MKKGERREEAVGSSSLTFLHLLFVLEREKREEEEWGLGGSGWFKCKRGKGVGVWLA